MIGLLTEDVAQSVTLNINSAYYTLIRFSADGAFNFSYLSTFRQRSRTIACGAL